MPMFNAGPATSTSLPSGSLPCPSLENATVCNPGVFVGKRLNVDALSDDTAGPGLCILSMDSSKNCHNSELIAANLRIYLTQEWRTRHLGSALFEQPQLADENCLLARQSYEYRMACKPAGGPVTAGTHVATCQASGRPS